MANSATVAKPLGGQLCVIKTFCAQENEATARRMLPVLAQREMEKRDAELDEMTYRDLDA